MTENEFICTVKRNNQRLFLIALSFTHDTTDSEDILQNVFFKFWRYNKPFENTEHIDKWLTIVTVNESKNFIKSPFRKRSVSLDEADKKYKFDNECNLDLFNAVMKLQKNKAQLYIFFIMKIYL